MAEPELLLADFYAPPTADEATLSAVRWRHTTAAVSAGGFSFRVRASNREFGRHLDRLLAGFPKFTGTRPITTYSVMSGVAGHPGWWAVYADERRISNCDFPSVALTHLFAHLNRAVVAHSPDDAVSLHAAACAWRGAAAVIAGPTESGKSTLAAGLALCGMSYLTDEVVEIDPIGLTVRPYPKPPSIDPGAWSVLPTLRPAESIEGVGFSQWHVDPAMLPGGVATEPVPVRLLLRCRWRKGSATTFKPTSRAALVVDLALDMFRPRERLAWQIEVLGRLAEQALAYDLVYDHLDEATGAIIELLDRG